MLDSKYSNEYNLGGAISECHLAMNETALTVLATGYSAIRKLK